MTQRQHLVFGDKLVNPGKISDVQHLVGNLRESGPITHAWKTKARRSVAKSSMPCATEHMHSLRAEHPETSATEELG